MKHIRIKTTIVLVGLVIGAAFLADHALTLYSLLTTASVSVEDRLMTIILFATYTVAYVFPKAERLMREKPHKERGIHTVRS